MKKVYGLLTVFLTLVLAGCTLTVVPGDGTTNQGRVPTVGSQPIDSATKPVVTPITVHPQNQTIEYKCKEIDLSVRYLNNSDLAEVYYEGRWNQLPRVNSSSGIHFANAVFAWNTSGRDAYLQKDGVTVAPDCSR